MKNLNVCNWKGPLEVIPCKSSAQAGPPVAQNCVQMAFEYLQGWQPHILHKHPVAVLSPPHSEKEFIDVWREPSGLQFVPLASGPVTTQRLRLLTTAKCFV